MDFTVIDTTTLLSAVVAASAALIGVSVQQVSNTRANKQRTIEAREAEDRLWARDKETAVEKEKKDHESEVKATLVGFVERMSQQYSYIYDYDPYPRRHRRRALEDDSEIIALIARINVYMPTMYKASEDTYYSLLRYFYAKEGRMSAKEIEAQHQEFLRRRERFIRFVRVYLDEGEGAQEPES
jgi:hypothetical protein